MPKPFQAANRKDLYLYKFVWIIEFKIRFDLTDLPWPAALRIRAATGLATGTEAFTQRFTAKLVFRRVDQDVKETLFAQRSPLKLNV